MKGSKQVSEIFIAKILYPKVVDAQVEPDRRGEVLPQAGSVRLFEVAMSSKACTEELVGKDASLWESVHAAAYFHVGITI